MNRGICIFAHNNQEIDYFCIALCNALMIKSNLKNNHITLFTDSGSHSWGLTNYKEDLLKYAFDNIVHLDYDLFQSSNKRKYRDTRNLSKILDYNNSDRNLIYNLSPYEETLLLDADYMIMDSTLDKVWGNNNDLLINSEIITLNRDLPTIQNERLDWMGIKQVWATAVYFKKNEYSKLFFDLVDHIKENYDFYQYMYKFTSGMYRNDFSFSIACHMMNGFLENKEIGSLPCNQILSSFDFDELVDVPNKNEMIFLTESKDENWKYLLTKVSDINVHIMNKYSIVRHSKKIISLYSPENNK